MVEILLISFRVIEFILKRLEVAVFCHVWMQSRWQFCATKLCNKVVQQVERWSLWRCEERWEVSCHPAPSPPPPPPWSPPTPPHCLIPTVKVKPVLEMLYWLTTPPPSSIPPSPHPIGCQIVSCQAHPTRFWIFFCYGRWDTCLLHRWWNHTLHNDVRGWGVILESGCPCVLLN